MEKRAFDTLRHRLRDATRVPHERVDHLFQVLDPATANGLASLLQVQHAAYCHLEKSVGSFGDIPAPPIFIGEIEADLAALDCEPVRCPIRTDTSALHPLGVAYVVAGSNSGAKIMERKWALSTDGRVLAAGHFLTAASRGDDWKRLVEFLRSFEPVPREESDILKTACTCFQVFETVGLTIMGGDADARYSA